MNNNKNNNSNNKNNIRKKRLSIDELSDVVTPVEAAAFFGVSTRTIMTWITRNELKSFKLGNTRLILKQEVLDTIGYTEKPPVVQENNPDEEKKEKEVVNENFGIHSKYLEANRARKAKENPVSKAVPLPRSNNCHSSYKMMSMEA